MKPFILCLILSALSSPAARVETFTLDLERPQQPFTLSITEATDATVTATLKASGSEFDPAGWTCLLWYGTTAGGITLTNSASSYGAVTWSVPAASVPTNGRYSVQVLGMITNVTEEWGRGAMTVRLNPARDFMPALWNTNSASSIAASAQRSADFVLALVETNTVSPSQLVSATGGLASASSVASVSGSVAVTQSALPGLATTGSLAAVSQLVSTGRVTRLHAASGTTMLDLSNTVPRVFSSGVFTNWTVVLSPTFSPRPWTGTTPHAFPFVLGNWTGFFDGAGRASIFYNMGEITWSSEEGYVSPQQLLSNDGGEAGFAVVSAVTTTRRNDAEILTDLTGYAKQSGTAIGEAYIQFNPDMNASISIAHSGIGYYSLATGLVTFTWPSDSGRLATTNDVEVAKAEASALFDLLAGLIDTNYYTKAQSDVAKELHADSYTNLVWRSVVSNGWHWLVPYTNTP